MRIRILVLVFLASIALPGCTGTGKTDSNGSTANEAVSASPAASAQPSPEATDPEAETAAINSPTAAITTFVEGIRNKNEKTVRSVLSDATLKKFDGMAKEQNKSFWDLVVGEDFEEMSKMPELRNEKINGDDAILEIRNKQTGDWDPIPFVKQGGNWKIALFDNSSSGTNNANAQE